MMLAAEGTELVQLQPLRFGLLILGAGVVLAFTLGALQCDLFSRHLPRSFEILEPLTRIELVTSSLPRTRSTN
jgi:hypothetical protein